MSVFDQQNRKNSVEQAAVGGGLVAAGSTGDFLLNRRLERKKAHGVLRSAAKGKLQLRTHGPHVAGKAGVRGLQLAGLPLLAYGAKNAVSGRPTRKVDLSQDVAGEVVRRATYQDQVALGQKQFGKGYAHPDGLIGRLIRRSLLEEAAGQRAIAAANKAQWSKKRLVTKELTRREDKRLVTHRNIGRTTSLAGGTMGLGALALRTPQGAKFAVKRGLRSGKLVRLASQEAKATSASNTLGIAAIGTGSAGSFNYAAQQKLERKRDLPRGVSKSLGQLVMGGAKRAVNPRDLKPLRNARKPLTRVGAEVEGFFDRRALKLAEEMMPTGARRGVAGAREHALVTGAKGKNPRFGSRDVQTIIEAPDTAGRWREAGWVQNRVFPTKHIMPTGLQVNPGMRGRGIGSSLMEQTQVNASQAKTPGLIWRSAGYKVDDVRGGPKGYQAWQRKGVKYVPGVGYGRNEVWPSKFMQGFDDLSPAKQRQLRSHMHRARVGLVKPEDTKALHPDVQNALKDQSWWGRVKGGQPFLGRTRRAAASGGLVAGGAVGVSQFDESKHRRSYDGKFATKGVSKAVPRRGVLPGKGRVQIMRPHGKQHFMVLTDRDETVLAHRNRLIMLPDEAPAAPKPRKVPKGTQLPLFGKAIDYDRVSPGAEVAHRKLRRGKLQQTGEASMGAGLAAFGGYLTRMEMVRKPRPNKAMVAGTALGTVAAASSALGSARAAHSLSQKQKKIESRAATRQSQGLYGKYRGLEPTDPSSRARNLAKSLRRVS